MNGLILLVLATVAQAAEPISEEQALRDFNAAGRQYARTQLDCHVDDYECHSQVLRQRQEVAVPARRLLDVTTNPQGSDARIAKAFLDVVAAQERWLNLWKGRQYDLLSPEKEAVGRAMEEYTAALNRLNAAFQFAKEAKKSQ